MSPQWVLRVSAIAGVLVLASACADPTDPPPTPTTTAPDTATTAVGTVTATATATATIRTPAGPIPASAFFVPPAITSSDQRFVAPATGFVGLWPLCGARYASDSQRADRRGRQVLYFHPGAGAGSVPAATVDHTISLYRAGAGPAALQQIRAAVQACPHDRRDGSVVDYRLLTPPSLGSEALLIEETWNPQAGTEFSPVTSLAAVVRIGDVITVLRFIGWEGLNASPQVCDEYTGYAVTAIQAWLR